MNTFYHLDQVGSIKSGNSRLLNGIVKISKVDESGQDRIFLTINQTASDGTSSKETGATMEVAVEDMKGLRDWLLQEYPVLPDNEYMFSCRPFVAEAILTDGLFSKVRRLNAEWPHLDFSLDEHHENILVKGNSEDIKEFREKTKL